MLVSIRIEGLSRLVFLSLALLIVVPSATQKSQFEHPRGELGTFDQRGMLVKADLVRGELATARRVTISGTLPPREKPPR
jgi:hypothetical protein